MRPGAEGKRKFLVIVDDTPECDRALLFAAKRASRTGAEVVALCIITPNDDFQHWLGVQNLMRAEAEEEAEAMLDRVLARLNTRIAADPHRRIEMGNRTDAIRTVIEEDPSISILVLAAATGQDGPGPLVSAIAGGQSGGYPIPITIVPGALTDEDIDAIV
ncbi:MAG: universal stress protein [Devosia sp.]